MTVQAEMVEDAAGCGPVARRINGTWNIDEIDRRTRAWKRNQTIRDAVLSDMGGEENTTEVQRQLVSKFATLAIQLEAMEAAAVEGKIDLDLFSRCSGHLRRIAETLGLRRVPRDLSLDPLAYAREHSEAAP